MKRTVLVALLALLCASCAFTDKRNRPLLNLCERNLIAEDPTTRALTAPVVLPTCLVAALLDIAVVHPAQVVDDAWYDTEAALWQPSDRGYATNCALLPLRAVFTPVVWSFEFVARSLFRRDPWPPSPARLERSLSSDDPEIRPLAARSFTWWSYQGADVKPATDAMLAAYRAFPKPGDAAFGAALLLRLPAPLTDDARRLLAGVARKGRGPRAEAALERLLFDCFHQPKDGPDLFAAVYDDLVTGGHHEAEAAVIQLLVQNVRPNAPGLEAVAFHTARSLARRNWPPWAGRVAFPLQHQLLALSSTAWIEAVEYEWPAIRLRPDWPEAIIDTLAPPVVKDASGKIIPPPPRDRAALVRRQTELTARLQNTARNQPSELLSLTSELLDIKTVLDAMDAAVKLRAGPMSDLALFLGNPIRIMCKQEDP